MEPKTPPLPIAQQIAIAQEMLPGMALAADGRTLIGPCPYEHRSPNGPRHYKIWFSAEQGPHDHCVHASCRAAHDTLMSELYRRLAAAARKQTGSSSAPPPRKKPLPPIPRATPCHAEPYDPALAAAVATQCPHPHVDNAWLLAHSPIPIPRDPGAWAPLMLNTLYRPGEHILIFTTYQSQGQLLHTILAPPSASHPLGRGRTIRLEAHPPGPGQRPPARPESPLPRGGESGVWYLTAPITGRWEPNPNNQDAHGARLGRRHAACCTRYPYLVLESDECPAETWLRILIQLRAPIVAIYTSGGKSHHALIRVAARTAEQFNRWRDHYRLTLSALGADPAAISPVRLSRLPGCQRWGSGRNTPWAPALSTYKPYLTPGGKPAPRLQTLLYLNPDAGAQKIADIPVRQQPTNP